MHARLEHLRIAGQLRCPPVWALSDLGGASCAFLDAAADLTHQSSDRAHKGRVCRFVAMRGPAQFSLPNESRCPKLVQGGVFEARPLDPLRLSEKVIDRESVTLVAVHGKAELFEHLQVGVGRRHVRKRQLVRADQIIVFHAGE